MLRSLTAVVCLLLGATALADKPDPPGTAKVISDSPFLVESTSGETFSQISTTDPVSYALTGPGKFQVDFRVNLKRRGAARPVNLEILAGGNLLTQLRINSRVGRGTSWRKVAEFKPSESAGFYLNLAPGSQTVIFRIDQAATLGAAVNVVDARLAKHPLGNDAPVLEVPVDATGSVTAEAKPEPAKPEPLKNEPEPAVKPVETHAEPAPASRVVPEGQPHRLSLVVGGGLAVSSETGAFDSAGAAQLLGGVALQLPHRLFASLDYEFRYGAIVLPVVGAGAQATPEIRHELGAAFGWAPVLAQRGDWALSLPVSLSYQLLVFSNQVAPAIAGLIGLDAGVRVSKGFFSADASIGYGQRIHDSTPAADASGGINGRLRWQAEGIAQVSGMLSAFVSYQGESLLRAQASRISNAMLAGVVLSFF